MDSDFSSGSLGCPIIASSNSIRVRKTVLFFLCIKEGRELKNSVPCPLL